MAYYTYNKDKAYTCGGFDPDGGVTVTIGYEMGEACSEVDCITREEEDNCYGTFVFAFRDGALTIGCSKELASEIASAFAAVAEA
jgi:hypothetical protein